MVAGLERSRDHQTFEDINPASAGITTTKASVNSVNVLHLSEASFFSNPDAAKPRQIPIMCVKKLETLVNGMKPRCNYDSYSLQDHDTQTSA